MPMTINVGLSRKLGLPDYGSIGATCNVQFEAEHGLLAGDLDAFHAKVKNAYAACVRAVNDELARQQPVHGTASESNHGHTSPNGSANGSRTNGHANGSANGSSGGRSAGRKATASQVRAIHAIINRQGLDLVETLRQHGDVGYAEDLTITQASQLIDNLKAANGKAR